MPSEEQKNNVILTAKRGTITSKGASEAADGIFLPCCTSCFSAMTMVFPGLSKTRWRPRRSNRIQDGGESKIPLSVNGKQILNLKGTSPMRKKDQVELHRSSKFLSDIKKKPKGLILDPGGIFAQRWNLIFFIASMISLFVDPVFFLLPETRPELCIQFEGALKLVLTITRSAMDFLYVIHILVHFRAAYVAPPSRVTGKGELVTDPWKIATRYLRFGFWIDLTAALPLPQVFIWSILPRLKHSITSRFNAFVMFMLSIQTLQMLHRFSLVYPLSIQLCKASGIITEKAWVGTAYNLLFYLFASFLSGTWWYILSVQRQEQCWFTVCKQESPSCVNKFFDCSALGLPSRTIWLQSSNITNFCNPNNNLYPYGIYSFTVTDNVSSGGFFNKYFYSLWWGIRNLSSQGQNLETSIDISENIFSLIVAILGLILFGFTIANMQKYIQSATMSLEEWRLRQNDLQQWMHHRQLPKELRQSILKYYNYKWVATQGAKEAAILKALPINLRRQTKRFLCLNLVRQVPLFAQLDDRTLDAICERLNPTLYTKGMNIFCEGEPVNEMLFIMRGHLYSYTTDGGRNGFFNSSKLGPNDFCGEELLMWVLDKHQNNVLPSSTRTVKAVSNVEGFSLKAEDLKFITTQFRRMHSRELRDKLRFYSQQWRTWAACFIQAAWRKHKRRKITSNEEIPGERQEQQSQDQQDCLSSDFPSSGYEDMDVFVPRPDAGIDVYAARLLADMRRSLSSHFG